QDPGKRGRGAACSGGVVLRRSLERLRKHAATVVARKAPPAIIPMTKSSEIEARAATWLIRREAPDFSADEQKELERWLEASPRHRSAFLRLEAAWRRADQLRKLRPLDG